MSFPDKTKMNQRKLFIERKEQISSIIGENEYERISTAKDPFAEALVLMNKARLGIPNIKPIPEIVPQQDGEILEEELTDE